MAGKRWIRIVRRKSSGVLVGFISLYQKILSPFLPPSCIYTPSCSFYAIEAIGKYGTLKGGVMALRRILRCTPFHKGGYDPVR
jgi:uncharacterized protein